MVVGNVARTRILAKILTKPNALLSKKTPEPYEKEIHKGVETCLKPSIYSTSKPANVF